MIDEKQYKIMQLGIEESKFELLEQESTIKMEKLKAEVEWEFLNVEKEQMKSGLVMSKSPTAEGRNISR